MEQATDGDAVNIDAKRILRDIWQELSAIPEERIKMKDEKPSV